MMVWRAHVRRLVHAALVQRGPHTARGSVTVGPVQGHRSRDQTAEIFRDVGPDQVRRGKRVRRPTRNGPRAVARVHRRVTSQKVVQRRADGVHVAARIGLSPQNLLEGRIREGVAKHAAVRRWRGGFLWPAFGEAEVQEDDLAARRPLQICGFDVPVNDRRLVVVQVGQRVEHGPGPNDDLGRWKTRSTMVEQLAEVIALDELHDQELRLALDEIIDDDRQRGMAQCGKKLRLAFERAIGVNTREPALLDGDRVLQPRVDRFVDGAHSAVTDLASDPVSVVKHGAVGKHVARPVPF